jgi:integrase
MRGTECGVRRPKPGVTRPAMRADRIYGPHAVQLAPPAGTPALAGEAKHPEIVLLLATTGLRWGEMAALRVRDIDLGRGRLMLTRSASKVNSRSVIGTPKTHQSRTVAVPVSVLKMLTPLMVGKAPDELLWCRADGQPLRPPTTSHWFGPAVRRCQVSDPTFPRVTVLKCAIPRRRC